MSEVLEATPATAIAFNKGDRVRLTTEGKSIYPGAKAASADGTVAFNTRPAKTSVGVKWDGTAGVQYFPKTVLEHVAGSRRAEDRIEGQDLVVVASDPQEMVGAQTQMIARIDEKIIDAERELTEARGATASMPTDDMVESPAAVALLASARDRLDAVSKRQIAVAERRVLFLQKIRAALAEGYVMMPNFPGHVVAIRTARTRPASRSMYNVHGSANPDPAQADAALPPGEGTYVSPIPEHTHYPADDKRQDIIINGWDEEIGLPVEFLKPVVVQRTVKAIDLKIFDEIVLIRDGDTRDTFAKQHAPPRGDPMVIGRIILRKPNQGYRHQRKVFSFLIAWFMDTKLI